MGNSYKKFQQFVEKKDDCPLGSKSKKPRTEIVADYPGKAPDKPPQGKDAKPYKAGKDEKRMTMKGEKDQEPITNKGVEKNNYQPKDLNICPVDGKKVESWPKAKDAKKKTKTEQFVEKTSKMSLSEFHDFMHKRLNVEKHIPPVTALNKGKIFPDPIEATRYVVAMAKANGSVMENLAHEIRRQHATKKMLANILDLPETYKYLAEVLQDPTKGSSRLRNLSRKLMEIVGNPVGFDNFGKFKDDKELEDQDDLENLEGDDDETGLEDDMDDEEGFDSDSEEDDEDEFDSDSEEEDDYEDDEYSDEESDEEEPQPNFMQQRPPRPQFGM